ncbi:Uncharacterized proteins involved in stress response, homologs of TerZ and putative cAMP-binding protein CABP1 [Tsukamurella pulmonis]|nr:Uncharacterized proteins involved in stress response, homologs of TerZ and putative cAMP-binding protein CABP1 [Tsukamurella pulmonis]
MRITSELSGLSDERALVFGEIYRRDSDWKIRAVGQGYSAGLSGLVTEFGIDVDDAEDRGMGDEVSVVENERGREAAEEVPARADAAVALARRRKPVAKIPADWKERLSPGLPSAVHAELWQRARLFPTVGIRSSAEQEGRTTSVLLSVMSVVPDFGRRIVGLLGAPRGRVETFSEVAFSLAGHDYRPDGVIRVTRGAKEWTALVEVKTAKGSLGNDQVESYIKLARAKGYDAVVTISCDLTVSSSELPFRLESRPPKSVSVFHLSWEAIVTEAALQYASETGDRVQQRLLEELLLYAADQQSGMWSFGDMGRHWVKVRDGIADGTLAATDVATSEICSRFDHLTCHAAMQLTSLTGRTVVAQIPRATGDSVSRAKQLADSGEVFGSLKISGATAPLIINANLARLRIGCSQSVVAPRSGRTSTKVNWLIRQLSAAPPRLRIAAHHFGSRTEVTSALLETVRDDPTVLLPQGGRDIREFTITAEASMGSKRSATENGFVSSLITLVNTFHRDVTEVVKVPRQDA